MQGSTVTADAPVSPRGRIRLPFGRLVRILLALAIFFIAAAIYGPQLIYTTSSDGVINARIITIASPIEGRIAKAPPPEGTVVGDQAPLMTVENPLVDRSRLYELEATRTRTEAELAGQKRLIEAYNRQINSLQEQMKAYLDATVARLTIAQQEAGAEAVAAGATAADAEHNDERKNALRASSAVSLADVDQADQAAIRTKAMAERARFTARRVAAELDAAKQGVLVAADRNDVPYSEQRIDEFSARKAEAEVQAETLTARLAELDREILVEGTRAAKLAESEIKAPASGVVWRPLVAQGSTVAQNAALMTLIDCSELYATATFSGRQFDDLHPGRTATVHILGTDHNYPATIVDSRAVGGTEVEERFAASLPKLGDRQILAVLKIDNPAAFAEKQYCDVGRRVEVRFTDKP
jgi:multidrug resistance efflux pump